MTRPERPGAAEYVLSRDDGSAAFAARRLLRRRRAWRRSPGGLARADCGARPARCRRGPRDRPRRVGRRPHRQAHRDAATRSAGRACVPATTHDGSTSSERVVKSVDMTFSVPKSVSVLWSQASPAERARLEADVLQAARETIDFMATRKGAVHRRVPGGGRVREPALGAAAALSLHVTARRADGDVAPAPQLHVHGVVVGLLRQDGRLVSPDPWNWYKHGAAREGGAYGRAVLAHRLPRTRLRDRDRHRQARPLLRTRRRPNRTPRPRCRAAAGRSRSAPAPWSSRSASRPAAPRSPCWRRRPAARRNPTSTSSRSRRGGTPSAPNTASAPRTPTGFVRGAREKTQLDDERELVMAIMRKLETEGPTVSTAEARAITLEAAAGRTSSPRPLKPSRDG